MCQLKSLIAIIVFSYSDVQNKLNQMIDQSKIILNDGSSEHGGGINRQCCVFDYSSDVCNHHPVET